MLWTKDEKKKRIGQIPGIAKVICEIRQPLRHGPIGFILEPKEFENRQFGVKSPHLVTLVRVRIFTTPPLLDILAGNVSDRDKNAQLCAIQRVQSFWPEFSKIMVISGSHINIYILNCHLKYEPVAKMSVVKSYLNFF